MKKKFLLVGMIIFSMLFLLQAEQNTILNSEMQKEVSISDRFVLIEVDSLQLSSNVGLDKNNLTISSFYMGKYEVTQKEWQAIMGDNPSSFIGEDLPVEQVSWYDAVDFCIKLSLKEGLMPAYKIYGGSEVNCILQSNGYRLPSIAEWEYAAKGASKTKSYNYSGSDSLANVAWYKANSKNKTHIVGSKAPNELGIYDMSGNVKEWCWNLKDSKEIRNKEYLINKKKQVIRGGSYQNEEQNCLVTQVVSFSPDFKKPILGFRLSRSKLSQKELYQIQADHKYKAVERTSRFVFYTKPPKQKNIVMPILPYANTTVNYRVQGTVVLDLEILIDGSVGAIEVIKSLDARPGGFDEAAISALKATKFKPASNNGKAVACWITYPVTFSLK